ncbi:MAG: hypothetical protein HKN11_12100 [Rhizobiales bacterium]|nr:hypothetical protein [Hyphomicrobiales bacterium]
MEFTALSLLGAFLMLIMGVAEYAVLKRYIYVPMRDRHERDKVTGSQKTDPVVFWNMAKAMFFVIMPLIGFVFGDAILSPFFR